MVDKFKALVRCLLATMVLIFSEKNKRKRKDNDLYAPMNVKGRLSFTSLEHCVPWDDAIVVLTGNLRKLWDSLSELYSSLC
jgi:hypothetical protein